MAPQREQICSYFPYINRSPFAFHRDFSGSILNQQRTRSSKAFSGMYTACMDGVWYLGFSLVYALRYHSLNQGGMPVGVLLTTLLLSTLALGLS